MRLICTRWRGNLQGVIGWAPIQGRHIARLAKKLNTQEELRFAFDELDRGTFIKAQKKTR
jgi:hypothetical protein